METSVKLEIKPGLELTEHELAQVNEAKAREWNIPPMDENHRRKGLFALLKDLAGNVVAQGELILIDNINFNGDIFSVLGIGGIISNEKGQGNGKKLIEGIKEYLEQQKKTGFGFTGNDVIEFYKKCGYKADYSSLKRFVHERDGQKVTNQDQEVVFYIDSDSEFMRRVLSHPDLEVYLPRDPDW